MFKCILFHRTTQKTLIIKGDSLEEIKKKFDNFLEEKGLKREDFIYKWKIDLEETNKKMSNLWYKQHKEEFFKKYSDEELLKDIDSYCNGKGKLNKVLNHFFEECIYKSIASRGQIIPYDAIQNDDVIAFILAYAKLKPNFYTTESEVSKVKTYLRNGGGMCGIGQKVANFCPRTARDIYFRYHDIDVIG